MTRRTHGQSENGLLGKRRKNKLHDIEKYSERYSCGRENSGYILIARSGRNMGIAFIQVLLLHICRSYRAEQYLNICILNTNM